MKKEWRMLMVLLVGLGVVLAPGVLKAWARPASPFHAYGPDRDKEHHGHGRGERGREKENRGRHLGWERDREGRYRFSEYDRREVENYYREHRDERWFHERGPRGFAFAYGRVIEPRYRRYCHPVPVMMMRELPPPPRGFRYFLFGGRVIMVDDGYRLHDFISLNFNFGR